VAVVRPHDPYILCDCLCHSADFCKLKNETRNAKGSWIDLIDPSSTTTDLRLFCLFFSPVPCPCLPTLWSSHSYWHRPGLPTPSRGTPTARKSKRHLRIFPEPTVSRRVSATPPRHFTHSLPKVHQTPPHSIASISPSVPAST
jgi:hypothetical protein